MPQCKNCQNEFIVYPEDRKFYEKFEVPEPTWCPDCRMQRRLAFRNNFVYYPRQCDLCSKKIISTHHSKVNFPVYCPECWWGDKWDRQVNAQDYDLSRGFFEQFSELLKITPRLATILLNCHNCDYADKSANSKDCYLIIGGSEAENCYYGEKFLKSRDCLDCCLVVDCELSYGCVDVRALYNCNFCQFSAQCSDCNFLYDCKGCYDCFGCWNLRNKKFHIFNQPYSEAEYNQKIKSMSLGSYQNLVKLKKEFEKQKINKAIHRYRTETHGQNNLGDYLFRCSDCQYCYNLRTFKDSRYTCDDEDGKDMIDCANCGYGELCYEIQDAYGNYFCRGCNFIMLNSFIDYSISVHSSKNCFGCSGLNKTEYCILNKKYSAEEYKKLKEKIIAKMKKDGEWGEFFPANLSPFGYNESKANLFYPLTKEQVLTKGWNWKEEEDDDELSKKEVSDYQIPDDIKEVEAKILDKVLNCEECGGNYKLIKQEFDFYKKKELAIPRKCFRCRYFELFNLRNPRKLWQRKCDKCAKELQSTYSPDRPEKVYCQECYQKEIY